MLFTRNGFAYSWVLRTELETFHTQAVEAAMCVDAALSAGVNRCALIYVHARLSVVLQTETGMASAL